MTSVKSHHLFVPAQFNAIHFGSVLMYMVKRWMSGLCHLLLMCNEHLVTRIEFNT